MDKERGEREKERKARGPWGIIPTCNYLLHYFDKLVLARWKLINFLSVSGRILVLLILV